jgi:hypothetical protein
MCAVLRSKLQRDHRRLDKFGPVCLVELVTEAGDSACTPTHPRAALKVASAPLTPVATTESGMAVNSCGECCAGALGCKSFCSFLPV